MYIIIYLYMYIYIIYFYFLKSLLNRMLSANLKDIENFNKI